MFNHRFAAIGRATRDPEMRYTTSGQAVTNLGFAIDDDYTNDNGEKVDRTIWLRLTFWGKLAEVANNYIKKGDLLYVEGKLVHDNGNPKVYQKNDGTYTAQFEVRVDTMRFLTSRNGQNTDNQNTQEDEGMPF